MLTMPVVTCLSSTYHIMSSHLPYLMQPDLGTALQEGLALQDGQGLLEAYNLSLTTFLPLLITFRLGNAPVLYFLVIVENCIELSLQAIAVTSVLRNRLVKGGILFGLVLYVLLHSRFVDFVLLCSLLILLLSICLFILFLRQFFREVRFHCRFV